MITNVAYGNVEETVYKVTTDNGSYNLNILPVGDSNRCYQHNDVDVFLQTHEVGPFVDPVDYMARMRAERDRLLAAIDWRVMRNITQVAHSETPTDDATKMAAIYTYQKDLRDFPANNPNTTTAALYAALEWPEEPA